ncbi:SWIM zinc finger family protein [Streptomyces sp. NPDC059874]|uniref:SWIM zinc finger family protein n=1 Tax=Streptomyces sp. NPDC059874 TaxID=3346983 RepID=UPI0036484D87
MSTELPAVAPEVLAEAVENLTARLRKKLDAATASCGSGATRAADGSVTVRFGEDALVTLKPGPDGTVAVAEQATCSCLLAPRCLHRAAVLGAAPLAEPAQEGARVAQAPVPPEVPRTPPGAQAPEGSQTPHTSQVPPKTAPAEPPKPLTSAQTGAAAALWQAAAEALAAGVTAGGAVVQAELLRAAHTARLAGLPGAEAAVLRVVRGLRAARDRRAGLRLADLTGAFRALLHTAALLAASSADPALTGTARRAYAAGGSLQVHGLCREPVLSATGYGGVVTHLLAPDGARYSVSDVRPGGLARARGAGSASVALGGGTLDHAGLARGGLRIVGATVSPEGRLGAGREVRATPLPGTPWTERPAAALFARPAAEAVAELLDDRAGPAGPSATEPALLGCAVTVVGASGEQLLVREVHEHAPLLRLLPAHPHPELPHAENLRRLASYPGLAIRVLGRPDLDRAATLRPLAVGPVPGAEYTLRLPEEWLGRADLGYDRLQGRHFPPRPAAPEPAPGIEAPDLSADSPLWRARRLVETGVAGGRRAVAEAARADAPQAAYGPLRRAGLTAAAELAAALVAEADRRPRDAFGRLADPSADGYARAWLAAATHLAAAERRLVAASWAAIR